jgi:O-antigen/teichoic acid export membrane protein
VEVKNLMSALKSFGYPLIFLGLLLQGITALDKFVLSLKFPIDVLGNYYAAFAVARTPIDVLCSAMNTGAFVRISALYNEGKVEQFAEALGTQLLLILGLTLPVLLVWWVCAADVGELIVGHAHSVAFQNAGLAVAIGAIAMNLRGNIFDAVLHMRMKNMLQIPALSCGLAVSVSIALSSYGVDAFDMASNMYLWSSVSAAAVAAAVSSALIKIRVNAKKLIALIAAFALAVPFWLLLIPYISASMARVAVACLLCAIQMGFGVWLVRR